MSRAAVTLTDTYVQVASGVADVYITKAGSGPFLMNDTDANDTTALAVHPNVGEYFNHNEDGPLYIRARDASAGWEILVVGVI